MDNSRIEPATATGTACNGTKFMAFVMEVLFSWERAGTYTCRICLYDADDVIHATRTDTGTSTSTTGSRVGTRDKGIRAMIDVEHRCLRTFKKDLSAFFDVQVCRIVRILYERTKPFGIAHIFIENRVEVKAFTTIVSFKETILKLQVFL